MSRPTEMSLDGYRQLVAAIVHRAVLDAQGCCSPPVAIPEAVLQDEARQWLAQEDEVRALVDLCGVDSTPVVQRVRRLLAATGEAPQLALFEQEEAHGALHDSL